MITLYNPLIQGLLTSRDEVAFKLGVMLFPDKLALTSWVYLSRRVPSIDARLPIWKGLHSLYLVFTEEEVDYYYHFSDGWRIAYLKHCKNRHDDGNTMEFVYSGTSYE